MERTIFIQSFTTCDVNEVEFTINMSDVMPDTGILKVIKTKEQTIVEANVPFEIIKQNEEDKYDFSDDFCPNGILIDAPQFQMRGLTGVFKKNPNMQMLDLHFTPEGLKMTGDL